MCAALPFVLLLLLQMVVVIMLMVIMRLLLLIVVMLLLLLLMVTFTVAAAAAAHATTCWYSCCVCCSCCGGNGVGGFLVPTHTLLLVTSVGALQLQSHFSATVCLGPRRIGLVFVVLVEKKGVRKRGLVVRRKVV